MQIYGFELFKYSLFVIFNNVYYSVFLTNNLYQPSLIIQHFDTNQINSLVILFVCQVMLPNFACIIYWSRQISHLRGVLEANNEIDSQRLNVGMNPRHAL